MDLSHYPAGPESVPADLTRPSAAYKRRAWLAVAGLLLFVALYLLLAGWFSWTAFSLIDEALNRDGDVAMGLMGACAAFLAVFMLKALFFVRHSSEPEGVLLSPEQQPRLVEFLHRLADEAGAPRPHRIYLSARVNAAVSYNLSVFNLLWPSKKNLEIGLGLVNVLTLGEFKAVCAHEFGHFAQGSMRVGIWVYLAQQIAAQIIAKRDVLDRLLGVVSSLDIRIAWIGWILNLIVWSIRSLMDSLFRLVLIAQRALSREMEMQADRVAVSLTGSDALVHALHKLPAADEAWERSVAFIRDQVQNNRDVRDAFSLQTRLIEHLGRLRDDPTYGRQPAVAQGDPQAHRVFRSELAQPPRMWSTHPQNHEREDNAKQFYVPAPLDMREAWSIFDNPQALRENLTAYLLRSVERDTLEAVDEAEHLARLDSQFDCVYFNQAYRGAYLGRSAFIDAESLDELYDGPGPVSPQDLAGLYPAQLAEQLEQQRQLEREIALLNALRNGSAEATGGAIQHRGQRLRRAQLPAVIASLREEANGLTEQIVAHERRCRTLHLRAARQLGQGWEAYLRGLVAVSHYATHCQASLGEADAFLNRTLAVETATRKVSSAGAKRVIAASTALFKVLEPIYAQRQQVRLDDDLLQRLGIDGWAETLGELGLLAPNKGNINEWVTRVDEWTHHASGLLGALRSATLEHLLSCEARVAQAFSQGETLPPAAAPSRIPSDYPTCLPDAASNRRQPRLGLWQRFQLADGRFSAVGRFVVAASIVGGVLGAGAYIGKAHLIIYNGLSRDLVIGVDGRLLNLAPGQSQQLSLSAGNKHAIRALTAQGREIESFEQPLERGTTIYNVAAASPLRQWTAIYSQDTAAEEEPDHTLGNARWQHGKADVWFQAPPHSLSVKRGRSTRRVVIDGMAGKSPHLMLGIADAPAALIAAHARWDSAHSPHILSWLDLAAQGDDFKQVINQRLINDPFDIPALFMEQEASVDHPAEHAAVCRRQGEQLRAHPDNPALNFLAIYCRSEGPDRDQAMLEGYARWPSNPWFAHAVGNRLASEGHWKEAMKALQVAANEKALVLQESLDLARIQRLVTHQRLPSGINALAAQAPVVLANLQLESVNASMGGPYAAYSELDGGNLDGALDRARGSDEAARVTWLVAASEGANREMQRKVLDDASSAGLEENMDWVALALAQRDGRDPRQYAETLNRNGAHIPADTLDMRLRVLRTITHGSASELERILTKAPPAMRGQIYAMGVILLGDKAPQTWRDGAHYLLFARERPYFR